jgi:starch phosphorylase
VVNNDPDVRDQLKVVFLPNFSVANGQIIYPAADLSEQISLAGKEASGTGNMKFTMNGALTIGTMDGANIEIREEVGAENFFLFGLTASEVAEQRARGYTPGEFIAGNQELSSVLDLIANGFFSRGDTDVFRPMVESLTKHDPYLLMADYQAYAECQGRVSQAYGDTAWWTRASILNVARSGKFSSDRTIENYAKTIWQVPSVPVQLLL